MFYFVGTGVLVAGTIAVVAMTRTPQTVKATLPTASPQVSMLRMIDVAKHTSASDCWTTIDGQVYDLTKYILYHPGGNRILQACGKDATDLFNGKSSMGWMHSQMAKQILSKYILGNLAN